MKRFYMSILIMSVIILLAGCNNNPTKMEEKSVVEKGPVTIATMIDSEGAILGNMMLLVLEENGFKINDETEFGTPDILRKALVAGEVDLVIDYTGSGQYYHTVAETSDWSDAKKGYELTKKLDKEANNIIWLEPANANNTESLAIKDKFSKDNNIKTMQDFADYVNKGGKVKLICASSFAENPKGLLGFEEAYGFKLKGEQLVTLASGNTAEMLKALNDEKDGINVSLVYGTDGSLEQMNLVVIEDTKSIPPVYLPTPVLRGALYEKYPEIETLLKPIFTSLTIEKLRKLNSKVAFEGQDAKAVAKDYLTDEGFLKK